MAPKEACQFGQEGSNLFSFVGVTLWQTAVTQKIQSFNLYKSYGHLSLVRRIQGLFGPTRPSYHQHSFCFMLHPDTKVTRLIPKRLNRWLGYPLVEIFDTSPELEPVLLRLENVGIKYLGDLVQREESEIRSLRFMTPELFELLKSRLTTADLGFGSSVPGWKLKVPTAAL